MARTIPQYIPQNGPYFMKETKIYKKNVKTYPILKKKTSKNGKIFSIYEIKLGQYKRLIIINTWTIKIFCMAKYIINKIREKYCNLNEAQEF